MTRKGSLQRKRLILELRQKQVELRELQEVAEETATRAISSSSSFRLSRASLPTCSAIFPQLLLQVDW